MRADTSSRIGRPFTTRDGRAGTIRSARRSDAVPCIEIVKEATRMRPRTIMTTTDEVWGPREWRRRMLGQGDRGVTLVADIGGDVAGLLGAARGDRPVTAHVAELGITVAERYRGVGVGRALMDVFEHWARSRGVNRLVLGVYDTNDAARRLYESMGYEIEGVERRSVQFADATHDTIRMAKFLR